MVHRKWLESFEVNAFGLGPPSSLLPQGTFSLAELVLVSHGARLLVENPCETSEQATETIEGVRPHLGLELLVRICNELLHPSKQILKDFESVSPGNLRKTPEHF